jgi:predicted metal-dependent hydrolase
MHFDIRRSSRAKRITIKIEPPEQIIVVAPKLIPKAIINKFIQTQTPWIEQNLKRISKHSFVPETKDFLYLFGKKFDKHQQFNKNQSLGIYIQDQNLVINYPDSKQSKSIIKKEIKAFVKKTATIYLQKQTENLAKKMNTNFQKLSLRTQKTRWGSCSSQDNLNLNLNLIHYPKAVIDYVIIHELAHLTQHNHSKKFWQIVARHDPNYKEHRKYLRTHLITIN